MKKRETPYDRLERALAEQEAEGMSPVYPADLVHHLPRWLADDLAARALAAVAHYRSLVAEADRSVPGQDERERQEARARAYSLGRSEALFAEWYAK
jgi:hypothetical protein